MIWTQLLTLDGEHQLYEPKRLRCRILHAAAQLTRGARQLTLHLPADWPDQRDPQRRSNAFKRSPPASERTNISRTNTAS